MVTAMDDDFVRTHDDARALIRGACPGATVLFSRLNHDNKDPRMVRRTMEFTLVMDAAPHHAVNERDLYTLPFKASKMRTRVREMADYAQSRFRALQLDRAGGR